ncbi:hypothetical protein N1031_17300 [Herbiconiux moechotypicola]|uniref:Uncharacterized protein n=1 Tax=Herbiconiux moechotypicola TaxID=637393 RepID=A0ABN3E2I2_9MICO|nr:hypothetical protein [Herbiconiux moechotypicola]MCS5731521.1 hypothetical protein [Herbiconiux moechotypicola]
MSTIDLNAVDLAEAATLWFEGALPARMLWHGERWRVSDRPTEPEGLYWATHAPDFVAWRFQATSVGGESRVFDVLRRPGEAFWSVAHVYD